jgi:hypothetical protein
VAIASDVIACDKIAKVEFFVDGNLINTLEDPPYETTWSPVVVQAGGHDILVRAVDINGYADEEMVRIEVGGRSFGGFGIVVAVALALAVLAVPLGLRARKRMRTPKETPSPVAEKEMGQIPSGVTQARLREIEGLNPDQEWMLPTSDEVRLGRKRDENDIPLLGKTASRRQAVIRFQNGDYYIYNLRPENPILIDGSPVMQQQLLQHGNTIQTGDSIFRFEVVS